MRLNPFSRSRNGGGNIRGDDDSSAEEDIAITKLKERRSAVPGRARRESSNGRIDPTTDPKSNLSYAGGSAVARGRTASRGRGAPSPSLRDLPPGAKAVVRGRSRGRSVNNERDDSSSSPEPVPRGRSRDARGRRRSIRRDRDDSSSPEPEMSRLSAPRRIPPPPPSSDLSRRSRPSRRSSSRVPLPPDSDSDDELDRERMSRSQIRRTPSRASYRSRGSGRMPPPPPDHMRRRPSRRVMDDDNDGDGYGYDPRRGRVSLSRSRSFNSRRAASLAPPSSSRRASYAGSERRRGSSRAPHSRHRSFSQAPPPSRRYREEEFIEKPKKRGFKALFRLGGNKNKKRYIRDDDNDDNSSLESVDFVRERHNAAPIMQDDESNARAPAAPETYALPKREAFANLYEHDNFPAIDRVPTAIGYQSDDSTEEVMIGGAPVPVADDKSVTSRYSVDVRSARSSKIKPISGDPNEYDDDDDDKYSQYLGGNSNIPLHSDDSDSCRPQWHHALDKDDSDWYDDYDEDDEEAMKRASKHTNKKYQVSGLRKKKTRQEKGEPSAEDTVISELKDATGPGDAIVANRSAEQEGNKVPRKQDLEDDDEFDEDDETGIPSRRRNKRRGKVGRKSHFDDATMDNDDASLSDDETGDETTRENRKNRKQKMAKDKGIIMNTHGKAASKQAKKGKGRGFVSRFKAFGRRNAGYGSDSDESQVSASVRLAQTQSMFSDAAPTLTKLEEEEKRESTATHNMLRNNRKEVTELDELDEMSLGSNQQQASCFPFSLAALNLGGTSSGAAQTSSAFCFYPSGGQNQNDLQLDDVQIHRLKDAKYNLENKPKVEVILQDLQDPLAEKYEQLERAQRKKKSEQQKQKEMQQEIERREREELLRMKREMREMEQKKLQMLQHKDALALQEAPDLKRDNNPSFVMDISDWVLKLDNDKTAVKERDTPRTNGRDGSDPVEKLPFSTIEVPTTTTIDSESAAGSSWGGRRKQRYEDDYSQPSSRRRSRSTTRPKPTKKKKGWFRRG